MASRWETLQDWIAVPSITGGESDYADLLGRFLVERGFSLERQEVSPGRFNLLARAGVPEVVFCTHLDTVPPFIAPGEDREFVRGRGSCDAKGPALAMIEAGAQLLAHGEERVGFLFTVGEETDSLGAQIANARLAEPWRVKHTIVGEPTGNRFVSGHKGIFKARLLAHGVAGHSSQSENPSAIHELVACLSSLLREDWGKHATLGPGTLNVGEIEGGVAANVIADRAAATLMLRAVEAPATSEAKLRKHLSAHVQLDCLYKNYGPVEFLVPAGETGVPVAFGTDAPHLKRWGTPLLYGPGRIQDAHTDHECVSKSAIELAIATYAKTAEQLLERGGDPMSDRLHGEELLDALESGALRVAERGADGNWIVNAWVKEELLAIFRASPVVAQGDLSCNPRCNPLGNFVDKLAFPVRRLGSGDGVRIVPGGSSIRRGAHVAPGVICMPPMYINVGAHVGAGTMIDSHALVGSCAQIGERVHLSAAAQVGGVLEPAQARPVIIEDDAFIGGGCGIYEGVLVRARAVLSAGVILTASTHVFDLVQERELRGTREHPLEIPEAAVVVPGTRPARSTFASRHGLQIHCALIVKYRDAKTDSATALEGALRG